MKKTLLIVALLVTSTSVYAGTFSVEPGAGFVISDGSAAAETIKFKYQINTPFFFEAMFLHGHNISKRDLSSGTSFKRDANTMTSTKHISDHTNIFNHNGYFVGIGSRMPLNNMLLNISIGGVYTKTNEKDTALNSTDVSTIDLNTGDLLYHNHTNIPEKTKSTTDNVSPYITMQLEQPINKTTSFLFGGTVYKTELHDILSVTVSLNFQF